jgi:Uma2 family endonuclease
MTLVLNPSHAILAKIAEFGSVEPREPVLLQDVSWEVYEEFLEELDRVKRRVRTTYDEGKLEIVTLGNRHEQNKKLLARLVETYADEFDLDVTGTGSVTLKIPKTKGLEPDETYYIHTAPPDISVSSLGLKAFPPPDLAIEVDISRSSLPRQPVYAFIAVPEVWRFKGSRIAMLHRKGDGVYVQAAHSLAFPKLSCEDVNRFLAMSGEMSQSAVIRAFRAWLRENR